MVQQVTDFQTNSDTGEAGGLGNQDHALERQR
jgi:hypothetical protein